MIRQASRLWRETKTRLYLLTVTLRPYVRSFAMRAQKVLQPVFVLLGRWTHPIWLRTKQTWAYKKLAAFYRAHPVFEDWRKKLKKWAWEHPYQVTAMVLPLLLLLIINTPNVFATTQGPLGPGTTASVVNGTSTTWTNPGNITASDSTYATASLASTATSDYLEGTNYGFTIPSTAIVNGVVVEAQEFATTASKNTMQDQTVSLIIGGSITGNNYATTNTWPTTNQYVSYGGSTDTWGTGGIAAAQVNASNFGVAIAATNVHSSGASSALTASVDYIRITVYYTVPSTFTQVSSRWYSVSGGTESPLAAQNTSISSQGDGVQTRLRMLLSVGTADLSSSGASFKLQ